MEDSFRTTITKSFLYGAICLVVMFAVSPAEATASEVIHAYDVDITIEDDGTFLVTETIEYDFGTLATDRHGIFRNIPSEHPLGNRTFFTERYIEVEWESVEMDGTNVPYLVEDDADTFSIRIGDPNVTVSGRHTYSIAYEVRGGLSYLEDGTIELYWNVIGDNWGIPIRSATARLHDPDNLIASARSCYRGTKTTTGSCGLTQEEDGVIVFRIKNLEPREAMTIAQALRNGKVEKLVLERTKVHLFWIPVLFIWFMALGRFVYQYRTALKPENDTIIPQYEPYEHFKPMYAGLLFDGKLDPKDITACIVYLAEQGFLKIEKIDKKVLFFLEVDDHEITLKKEVAHIESAFQRNILELLFGPDPLVGDTVTLSKLKGNRSKQQENQRILRELKKDLETDLENNGFFQINIPTTYLVVLVIILGIAGWILLVPILLTSVNAFFITVGIIVSTIILLFMYRRRTTKGYEAMFYLEGFKQFLSVTEKDRYIFHNAPEKSPEQFMKYLPYAIAFGVEEEWAEVFKDITIPSPEWYDGGSPGVGFSSSSLTTSLGSFATAFASSSGSSASSGGGSAGGGGGGGGGGSW